MFSQFVNPITLGWRSVLAIIAIAIVTGTIFYSNYLAKKIARDEREKVDVWVQSLLTRAVVNEQAAIDLTNTIASHNTDIPIIETDEKGNPSGQGLNLDSNEIKKDTGYLRRLVNEFKQLHDPITLEISKEPLLVNKYYYGDSKLLQEVRYYPLIQLLIVAMFIIIMLITINVRNKSTQNQVWAGMAKETAHQLGTPLSSLQGWVELLKEKEGNEKIVTEMSKDVERLKLVSDRFGKIGSTPQLEEKNIVDQVTEMVNYIKRRAPEKVHFSINTDGQNDITALINGPLFDWVIENLLKNALDAMEGKGSIRITIKNETTQVVTDITDTGKGISKQHVSNVFKPGFTTKKRGWGLGLSLAKRIMEQYHKGELFVKNSEPGKGTTFRIVLKK
ncbi:MAG TPA: HAMP domain-containing sensor histidine kinase [Ferruginibacter sp.]|nr:HAMP domain-containing sensor histidine kinase [Ferruginibacter sp.]HPH92067.1 HAMP domain-containing sensor histidine kinase [Ferruginibacter sp.]